MTVVCTYLEAAVFDAIGLAPNTDSSPAVLAARTALTESRELRRSVSDHVPQAVHQLHDLVVREWQISYSGARGFRQVGLALLDPHTPTG